MAPLAARPRSATPARPHRPPHSRATSRPPRRCFRGCAPPRTNRPPTPLRTGRNHYRCTSFVTRLLPAFRTLGHPYQAKTPRLAGLLLYSGGGIRTRDRRVMSHTETRSCSARQEVDRHLSPPHRAVASAKPARRGPILGRPRRRCMGSGSGLLPIRAPRSALRMLSAAREATPPSLAGPAGELKPNCAAPASTSSPEKDVKRT